jgi:esterase/lipase
MLVVFLTSCATINVSEKSAFQESKYKFDEYSNYINKLDKTPEEKKALLYAVDKVINKDDVFIGAKNGVELQRNFLTNNNAKMEYFVFKPKNADKVGVYFLGNGSNIFNFTDNLFELSDKTNSKIYVLNYRGYGKSDGTPSFKTQFDDDNYFYNYIKKNENKIDYVVGYSLGSIFATYLTVDNNIKELFLLSPFSDTKDYFDHFKNQNMKGAKSLAKSFVRIKADDYLMKISNVEKIKNYKGKLVVFHGTQDNMLPYSMGKKLIDNSVSTNKKMYTIPQGNHGSAFNKENWENLVGEINKS